MPEDIATRAQNTVIDALCRGLGDAVTSLWDYSLGFVVNFIFLRCNFDKLEQEQMLRLTELRDDVSNRANNEARQPHTAVTSQASGWIKRVERLESEFTEFQNSFDRLSICSVDGFCLGHSVAKMLRQVEQLTVEGKDLQQQARLVAPRVPDAIERVPCQNTRRSIVGAQETLQQIQAHVLDDRVGIIGIYGMGGIGKTTLLQLIHNEFLLQEEAKDKFEVAIWVTVSQKVDILNIQREIGECVNLSLSDSGQGDSDRLIIKQAKVLFRELSAKRFILFLDDVWEGLNIVEIGIPLPKNEKNNCKVLFTTRSWEVCSAMDADQQVKVSLLDDESSWRLFLSKVGIEVVLMDGEIQQLAKKVVARCGGLPISLITVGRAMAGASTPYAWRNAINSLANYATELKGMKNVLASLKFSFDMLKIEDDTRLQSCLLYCVLFPEDYNIPKGNIIDYWICEGFLDREMYQDRNINETRDRGHDQIRQLQNACLLEEGIPFGEQKTVRLHDTVRDMALWITREKFLALAGYHTTLVPDIRRWKGLERISLMWNQRITELPPPEVSWPHLTTLLLDSKRLDWQVFDSFLKWTPALRVLDLSHTGLSEFPVAITSLVMLQYLNLSQTSIKSLPKELGNLIHLRQLIMDQTGSLETIPHEAITPLSSLQVLSMNSTEYVFGRNSRNSELVLSDLENLRRLCELSLIVHSSHSLKMIADSNMLRRCVRSLEVEIGYNSPKVDNLVSVAIGDMPELRELYLQDSEDNPSVEFHLCPHPNIEHLSLEHLSLTTVMGACEIPFPRLRGLEISHCHGLTELSWVYRLPCLEDMEVRFCRSLRVVLHHGDGGPLQDYSRPLSKLQNMTLSSLPALSSISRYPLLFPSLEILDVSTCPLLRWPPYGPQSAKKLKLETAGTFVCHGSSSMGERVLPFQRLTTLRIYNCDGLTELSWVDQLPCLKGLAVRLCSRLSVVLRHGDGGLLQDCSRPFSNLQWMTLMELPALTSISPYPVLFSSLEKLHVWKCPLLRRLPFGPQSAKKLTSLKGEQEWWDGLEWDTDANQSSVKSTFQLI